MHNYQVNDKLSKLQHSMNITNNDTHSSITSYYRQFKTYQKGVNNVIHSVLCMNYLLHIIGRMTRHKNEHTNESHIIINSNEIKIDRMHRFLDTPSFQYSFYHEDDEDSDNNVHVDS